MDAPSDNASQSRAPGRPRRRPLNACATCRARKVKCDERPNGCVNCEKLQLDCVQKGVATAAERKNNPPAVTGIKRKRTFRSCVACRDSKVKCSGERPVCTRCTQRAASCVYDSETTEPAWVQSISPSTSLEETRFVETKMSSEVPQEALVSMVTTTNCIPALAWLAAPQLPAKPQLHSLLESYFNNIHPIRIFAFVHKPSFMRRLDEGLLTSTSDQALLHIMCALGARFYALEYSESTSPLPPGLVQSAGSQWAKTAEEMFFADYSAISITKLKVLVLLHDHEARTGNYAGSFLLTGLIIRMAHALQINLEPSADILCKEKLIASNDVSIRESRRRLMWACYMVDVWAGSGIDQLTILNEKDIKIQLPSNERQFLLQIPCITECLQNDKVLEFIPNEDKPEKPFDNMGISAYYIRIVHLWKRALRFVKHLDDVQPLWSPDSEFAKLIGDVHTWKQNLPTWLEFSSDNIYIRRESSQLGALFLIHCMYHHVLCDIHRVALPELFKTTEPFAFPPGKHPFKARLQTTCFENAQRVSILISTTLQHGVKHLADPILPSFAYNSNRIMLYYIARILDMSKPDAVTVFNRTIELVQQNNQALRRMALLYPLAEPLYVTTERWLDKVRTSIMRGQPTTYIGPQDPSNITEESHNAGAPNAIETAPDSQLNALSVFPLAGKSIPQSQRNLSDASQLDSTMVSNSYDQSSLPAQQPQSSLALQSALQPIPNVSLTGIPNSHMEQPVFDLNDLHNFWEWENDNQAAAINSGFEGFGPLGWMNNFSSGL